MQLNRMCRTLFLASGLSVAVVACEPTSVTAPVATHAAIPTPDPMVRSVTTRTTWMDEAMLTWVLTGRGEVSVASDGGFLGAGSLVRLVPGAAEGSHQTRMATKLYAAATLVTAANTSASPPNRGVTFWISEADLRPY